MTQGALARILRDAAVVAVAATAALAASLAGARDAAAQDRDASVGYVFPAGARRGAVVQVIAGGQNLRNASAAFVSGDGVRASVLRWVRPLSPQQMRELRLRIDEARGVRVNPKREREELPDHPALRDLAKKSPKELRAITARFLGAADRRQRNAQIAETVEIEVTLAPDAEPGDRELRILTPAGLTNPLRFQVGTLQEACEDEATAGRRAETAVASLPVVLNGQILPGDADRFRFRAARGSRLVVDASARRLVPFLADAVPGWFQATVSLLDGRGVEVAFADDGRFEPDPVMSVVVPADGEYVLEIRDSLWRGREDFVYRVTVDEQPNVGTTPGRGARADADLDPGDRPEDARPLALPATVSAWIERPGDVDWFMFEGRTGEEVVAEITARRAQSPLDSVITLVDPAGAPLVWNDDHEDGEPGVLTHHADSYLRARLPADGIYRLKVADAQRHGGPDFSYRLRVGPPAPDFELVATPSGLVAAPGRAVPFRVQALRKDGFDGAIAVRLVGAPAGFVLDGGGIAPGRNDARMTLTASADVSPRPVALRIEGRAVVGGAEIVREATPADDRLQAFVVHHLAPAQEFCVAIAAQGGRAAPPVQIAGTGPVRLAGGGEATVRFRAPGRGLPPRVWLRLDQAPPGVSIASVTPEPGGFAVLLRAQSGVAKAGTTENLIVEIIELPPIVIPAPAPPAATSPPKEKSPSATPAKEKKGAGRRADGGQSRSIGWLPAIPIVIGEATPRTP